MLENASMVAHSTHHLNGTCTIAIDDPEVGTTCSNAPCRHDAFGAHVLASVTIRFRAVHRPVSQPQAAFRQTVAMLSPPIAAPSRPNTGALTVLGTLLLIIAVLTACSASGGNESSPTTSETPTTTE